MKKVSIVIPCYNEESNIEPIISSLRAIFSNLHTYELILVDDGSNDRTLEVIKSQANLHPEVKYVSFSRNFGHQYALIAGLTYAEGDCVITMDADLQHPPQLVPQLIAKWEEGYDIVYTIRKQDKSLSFFKRSSSGLFYKILNFFSDLKMENGEADFRLLDKKVLKVFKEHIHESSLFLRGLINWVGYKKISIEFIPDKRYSGTTKYSVRKMLNLAIDGITSFSVKPLRMAVILGLLMSLFSFLYAVYAIIMRLFTQTVVGGWTSTILSILFVGGMIILLLGVIGEYIGKIYFEVKRRPRFIIRESSMEK
jgi:glycosyltransferase involved in cell wall biosynthesis